MVVALSLPVATLALVVGPVWPAPPGVVRSPPARMLLRNPLGKLLGEDKKKAGPLTTGLDAVLKDAPLPVKALAQLAKPLVGALESMIEESAADQDALLSEAQSALRADPRA